MSSAHQNTLFKKYIIILIVIIILDTTKLEERRKETERTSFLIHQDKWVWMDYMKNTTHLRGPNNLKSIFLNIFPQLD